MREYQLEYASNRPQMYDRKSRIRKGYRMIKTIQQYYGEKDLTKLSVLDIGSSTGIIDNYLAKYFQKVTGIDVDKTAVNFAKKSFKKKNLIFRLDDAMKLSHANNTFDVVICTHIYEHVPDAKKLFSEIYRVLKPGGVCYLAALNKWWPIEPHYNLPFLAWIPKNLADIYLRIFKNEAHYYEKIQSYWELKENLNKFTIIEYTEKILRNPEIYGYQDTVNSYKAVIAYLLSPLAKYLTPTFFWLLVKKNH